jgi:hypothetical protein
MSWFGFYADIMAHLQGLAIAGLSLSPSGTAFLLLELR